MLIPLFDGRSQGFTFAEKKPTMAKATTKPAAAPAKKKAAPKASVNIVKVAETILDKLKTLNIESGLQSDIVWCLGSYGHDKNPSGLYEKAEQALAIFKDALAKKTKGVTAKFVADIELALAAK